METAGGCDSGFPLVIYEFMEGERAANFATAEKPTEGALLSAGEAHLNISFLGPSKSLLNYLSFSFFIFLFQRFSFHEWKFSWLTICTVFRSVFSAVELGATMSLRRTDRL